MTGVEVKTGVGVRVSVGVRVGNAGVKVCVAVWAFARSIGIMASEVCVNPTTIVCAMAVLTEFGSDMEIPGKVQPCKTANKIPTNKRSCPVDKRVGVLFSMFPPFVNNCDQHAKTRDYFLEKGTSNF
jgi:hypothetical protein